MRTLTVPFFFPIGAVVRRFADAHVREDEAAAAVRLVLEAGSFCRCERTVAIVEVDDQEVVVRRGERVEVGFARGKMLGIQQREEVFHLLEARDVRCIFFLRRARRNHIQETVAGFGNVASRMSERFCLGNFLALHIVEREDGASCEQRLSQHGGEVFFRLRIAPLGRLSFFLIAVIEDRLHEDAVERSDEPCDVFLGIVLRHFQKPHGAVADEQEVFLTGACIAAESLCEIDHRRFRHDGDASRGVLRRICDKGRLLQPEESRRS